MLVLGGAGIFVLVVVLGCSPFPSAKSALPICFLDRGNEDQETPSSTTWLSVISLGRMPVLYRTITTIAQVTKRKAEPMQTN